MIAAVKEAEAPRGVQPGDTLDDRYLIEREIGVGGVGVVYEARNIELDERVAIKCLKPEFLADTAMVARFAREAKASASIRCEYVVTVHDVGISTEGVPFIVMELLAGRDLGARIAEGTAVAPRIAVEYGLQSCEALAVAHARGIVHRDIKPENVFLVDRPGAMHIVKVLDFGISKTALTGSIFGNELPLVTTANLMGTPLYMSPEQVRCSDKVDARSDIWALGMVLYEVLTGQPAFTGQSITELCAQILESTPESVSARRSDVDGGLSDVIMRCLEKDADRRYQSVAELAMALRPFGPKRARINVERAVAVLQHAGHFDSRITVTSTMPPPEDGSLDVAAMRMPSAPRLPTPTPMPSPSREELDVARTSVTDEPRVSEARVSQEGRESRIALSSTPQVRALPPAAVDPEPGDRAAVEMEPLAAAPSPFTPTRLLMAAAAVLVVVAAVLALGRKGPDTAAPPGVAEHPPAVQPAVQQPAAVQTPPEATGHETTPVSPAASAPVPEATAPAVMPRAALPRWTPPPSAPAPAAGAGKHPPKPTASGSPPGEPDLGY